MSPREYTSEGAQRLGELLERLGLTLDAAAKRLDTSAPTVHRWLTGETKPSLALALKVEKEFGISTGLWTKGEG